MKSCSVCKVRQSDELIGDDDKCTDFNRCIENQKRTMREIAELYNGLVAISQAIYGWQKRIAVNAVEKGFRMYDHPPTRENIAVFVANLHSEASEFWEAYRDGKLGQPCSKAEKMNSLGLPILTCAEEELAYIIIRTLDTADSLGIDLTRAITAKHVYNTTRAPLHGGKLA